MGCGESKANSRTAEQTVCADEARIPYLFSSGSLAGEVLDRCTLLVGASKKKNVSTLC